MKYRILTQLKTPPQNSKRIFGFDIETKQHTAVSPRGFGHVVNEFYMGSVVGKNLKKVFYDKEEMQRFMTSSM